MVQELVKIKDKEFERIIPAERIGERVRDLADRINADYRDKNPLFLGVLNGAFLFTADLFKCLTLPCEISFIKVASYSGNASTGTVKNLIGLNENIEGRHLVVVEDIVDTGDTMHYLMGELARYRPASVKVATLLFKPRAMKHDFRPDYTGFEIDPAFVVGYGLDFDGYGRNLNDIFVLKKS